MKLVTSMRTIRFWICRVTIMISIGTSVAVVRGQEASRTIDQTFEFDERGDAKIEMSSQYSAVQWEQWKNQYGDHQYLLQRDLGYALRSADIEDFARPDIDDLHRHAAVRFKARALARYRGDGQFMIEVPKQYKLVAGSGRDWAFTSSSLANGEILNSTFHTKLPEKAQNAHYSPGGDFDQLTYTLEVRPPRPKLWLEIGIVLLIAGAATGLIAFGPVGKTTGSTPAAST